MEKQCAGCGEVFEDGQEPRGAVTPRPYGCCPKCNTNQFRTHEQNEVKAPEKLVTPTVEEVEQAQQAQTEESA